MKAPHMQHREIQGDANIQAIVHWI